MRCGVEAEAAVSDGALEEPFGIALRLALTHRAARTRLRRAFDSDHVVFSSGRCTVSLFSTASQRMEAVTIDDRLPCPPRAALASRASVRGSLHASHKLAPWHARSARPHELWLPLLHKAMAKLAGSYLQLTATPIPDLVVALTGGLVQTI